MEVTPSNIVEIIDINKALIDAKDKINPTVRDVLYQNLQVMSALYEEVAKYKDLSTVGAVRKLYSSTDAKDRDEVIEVLERVQDYLTEKESTAMQLMDTESDKKKHIEDMIENYIIVNNISVSAFKDQKELIAYIQKEITGLSVLEEAFNGDGADSIEEIQVNDYNDIRYVVKGREERTSLTFRNVDHVKLLVDRLSRQAAINGTSEHLSEDTPFIRLRRGIARISIMASPIAISENGKTIHIAIRKQRSKPFTREFLINGNSINEYGDLLLETLTMYGVSMAGYGGTGTGKTAMLRRYLSRIQDNKRVITIAENDEMGLRRIDHREFLTHDDDPTIPIGIKKKNPNYLRAENSVLMWECTNSNIRIVNNLKGFDGMLNASLTFTPTVIVLQESKGGEIKAVIEEAISGHQVFTTVHANSPEAFFLRILLMYQQAGTNISDTLILKQIPIAFPVIVKFERFPDGTRKISEISELIGFEASTQDPKFKTLLKFQVEDTVEDPTKKPPNNKIVKGKFLAGEFLSERLIDILKHGGIDSGSLSRLEIEHDRCPKLTTADAVA